MRIANEMDESANATQSGRTFRNQRLVSLKEPVSPFLNLVMFARKVADEANMQCARGRRLDPGDLDSNDTEAS